MSPATHRVLTLLAGAWAEYLVRGPTGWRVVSGAAFERVKAETAEELLEAGWIEGDGVVYRITAAGRIALKGEPCQE